MRMSKIYIDLQTALDKNGLKVSDLARLIGERPQVVHGLKQKGSNKRYSKELLEKICTVLNVNIDQIIRLKGTKPIKWTHRQLDIHKERFYIHCNLEKILLAHEMSILQLSKEIDETYANVRLLAKNEAKRFSQNILEKITSYFNCTIADLFSMVVVTGDFKEEKEPTKKYLIYFSLGKILKDRKISVQKVADDTGLPYSFVRRMRDNKVVELNLKYFEILCEYFQVSPDKILKANIINVDKNQD